MWYCRHILNLNIIKYCNIPTNKCSVQNKKNNHKSKYSLALEIRSIGSQCVRDNTWIARAFSAVCSVCWFSYRDKSFQSIDSLLWSSWSYLFYALNSKALMQPVSNASELALKWVEDVWLFIKSEREKRGVSAQTSAFGYVRIHVYHVATGGPAFTLVLIKNVAACIKMLKEYLP